MRTETLRHGLCQEGPRIPRIPRERHRESNITLCNSRLWALVSWLVESPTPSVQYTCISGRRTSSVRSRYVIDIYIYIWHHPNVGDYTSPMECLGYVSCECLFKHCKGLHAMIMNGGWGCPQHSMGLELRGMFPLNEDDPWGSTVPMHSSLAGSVMILALPEFLLSTLQSWPTHDSPTPFT